ncbi:MAG: hypothetical protein VB032_02990 [Burkholderiaceae bacterium]|nr:hypothetical protein [Burkholderiaceae bacterium]
MRFTKKFTFAGIVFVSALLAGCSSLSHNSSPLTLDEKLAKEYQRYEKAQQLVLAQYQNAELPREKKTISRSHWEEILAAQSDEAFTTAELAELRGRQERRIEASRKAAVKASIIDFSPWRTLPTEKAHQKIRQFCEAVPKGGMLHVHPWGSLSAPTFKNLLATSNPVIPAKTLHGNLSDTRGQAYLYPDELAWLETLPAEARFRDLSEADRARVVQMGILPAGTHSFERFEAPFRFVALVMASDWHSITVAYEDFAQRAVRAGVQYVEFTESISPEDVPRYERLAAKLVAEYGLVVRFNVAFFRTHNPASQHLAVKNMLNKMESPIITGIDLLANEMHAPALETGQAVYGPVMAANVEKKGRWHRTMHAGEHGDARNPRDALLLGAERLGHGVRLAENPVVMQYAADQHVPIEINLTSNLKLRAIEDIRAHPYLTYLRLGMPVSLSTDDEGIFETDINGECELAVAKTDVTYHEYKQMAFNSIQTSFASDDIKRQLLEELRQRFDRFEQKQKSVQ